jgi:hypothetical protein
VTLLCYCDEGDHFLRLIRFLRGIGGRGLEPWAGGWIGWHPYEVIRQKEGLLLSSTRMEKDISVSVYPLPGKREYRPRGSYSFAGPNDSRTGKRSSSRGVKSVISTISPDSGSAY